MKLRIVKLGKKFAVERGWLFKRYSDLTAPAGKFWWPFQEFTSDCWSKNLEEVKERIADLKEGIVPYVEDRDAAK